MTRKHPIIFLILLWAVITTLPALAAPSSQQEIVKATLVSETDAIEAGKPFRLGVLLEPRPHWHTYWENPGDAGIPTSLSWTLPEGFSASAIDWPPPQRLLEGPLATFGYAGDILLPVTITPPAMLDNSQPYLLKVKASWLVCEEICIPESADLDLVLPAGKIMPSAVSGLFATHDRIRPIPLSTPVEFSARDHSITLNLAALGDTQSGAFFPRQANIFQHAAEQIFSINNSIPTLEVKRTDTPIDGPLNGLLTVQNAAGEQKTFDITLAEKAAPTSTPSAPRQTLLFPVVLLFALLGGLILNLMPCVLPVLSLKALAVVKKAGGERTEVLKQGIAYTLGILVSFAAFAGVLIALQKTGSAVGWGFQMQSPAFVGFLIYLLFVVGLTLSGFFHLPVLLGNIEVADESSTKGSFFTGVLATAVATPCTAPFMASAVGVALSLPVWKAMLVFETLALGLALPFLLISIFPHLLKFLPKPGAWMERFKELLAFPMYASVIWLLWVLTMQTSASGMAIAAGGMLAIVIIIWMKPLFKERTTAYRITALLALAAVLGTSLPALSMMEAGAIAIPGEHAEHKVDTVPYSKDKLAELRAQGKPVFIDATAAWCITCQVNARVAIHTDRTMRAFEANNVTLMIADWTRRNQEITELLSSFGYQGVPLYVFYPARGEPIVLPQLLTEDMIINLITNGGSHVSFFNPVPCAGADARDCHGGA